MYVINKCLDTKIIQTDTGQRKVISRHGSDSTDPRVCQQESTERKQTKEIPDTIILCKWILYLSSGTWTQSKYLLWGNIKKFGKLNIIRNLRISTKFKDQRMWKLTTPQKFNMPKQPNINPTAYKYTIFTSALNHPCFTYLIFSTYMIMLNTVWVVMSLHIIALLHTILNRVKAHLSQFFHITMPKFT